MKTVRISLAVASGTLLGLGYIACSDHEKLDGLRILVGIIFAAVNVGTMIARPERFSPKVIYYLVIPLILALMVHEVRTGTLAEAVVTIAVGIAFVAVQLAMSSLPVEPSLASASERKSAVPPEDF